MGPFGELLGCDHRSTIKFFFMHLRDEVTSQAISRDELIYVAFVLAHHAQISLGGETDVPLSGDLSEVYDNFVSQLLLIGNGDSHPARLDAQITEAAGGQTLLLAGFFRDQARHRHNVRWFDRLGQTFYSMSAQLTVSKERNSVLHRVSKNFHELAKTCRNVNRVLRDNPYLIRSPDPPAA